MNSPILDYLAAYGIDPAYLMIALFVLLLIMIILYIKISLKLKTLNRTYDRFMQGKNMESMEEIVMKQFDRLELLEESDKEKRKAIKKIEGDLTKAYQKSGIVKYDAFRELSGSLSYALALLDKENNGVLINSMYSREGNYSYIKEIKDGKSSINLSEEEKKALELAVNSEENAE